MARRAAIARHKVSAIPNRRHVNRINGLLFSQGIPGYQPLRSDRRQRLEELKTSDGRAFPPHFKALVNRELDRLVRLLKQIKTVEVARDALPAVEQTAKAAAAMLLEIRGIGPEFAAILWSEGLFRHFENRRQIAPAIRPLANTTLPVRPSSGVLFVSCQEGARRQYVDANAVLMG